MGAFILYFFQFAEECFSCRNGSKFCVACRDVDCHETSKDDPALSQHAAERVVEEEAFSSSHNPAPAPAPAPASREDRQSPLRGDKVTTATVSPPVPSTVLPTSAPTQPQAPGPGLGARPKVTGADGPRLPSSAAADTELLTRSAAAVTATLEEATRELASCRSADRATQLVILVREAATSLATLRHILCDTL